MADSNLKPFSINNIKSFVPLILDLNQLNYDYWRVLFETHCRAYGVYGHLDCSSRPKDAKDEPWHNLDILVAMWIYVTLTQPLLTMVLKSGYKARDVWKALEDLFRDNKDACAIELENELRSMLLGDRTIVDYCQKLNVVAELLANIESPVPEKTLVVHLLNGLGPKFDNISTVIRHREPLPNFLQACSMLVLEEQRFDRTHPLHAAHSDHSSSSQVLHIATDGSQSQPWGTLPMPQIATTTTEDHHATIVATIVATAVASSPRLDVNNSSNSVLNSRFLVNEILKGWSETKPIRDFYF
ncbi:uncharacterized protein LOC128129200 [Lactuca sativa]|uniref:uncharacterized protein LOC128129200 n=1 Tax=Lactuca sativa TaxID=4236 RepID=UPI0022B01FFF|nr:uncharacterized protein LOC128129200 [Lactuca sativa]